MAKFRKKPVIIDAIQFDGTGESCSEVTKFIDGENSPMDGKSHDWKSTTNEGGFINTLEGKMEFSKTDYIIKGIKGEFYPCKQDIFEASYEKVD